MAVDEPGQSSILIWWSQDMRAWSPLWSLQWYPVIAFSLTFKFH